MSISFFQISWIRHSDSALLYVNDFKYTSSHRVKAFHDEGTDEWRLSINPVEVEDKGLYECQASTTPHTSHFMAIEVIGKMRENNCCNKDESNNVFL